MRKVSSIPVSAALIALVGLSLGSCNIAPTALTLQAADQWLATGVEARPGDVLLISATGLISYNSDLFPDAVTGPNGELSLPTPAENEPATADTYPLPTARYGALVGKIGSDGDVFFIGAEKYITADTAGELYLTVNDNLMDDNTGFFDVTIQFGDEPGGGAFM